MMNITNCTIIGCGSLGSFIAYNLCLYNNKVNRIKTLTLIDKDDIDAKSFPYVTLNDKKKIGKPKVNVLSKLLLDVNSDITIKKEYKDINDITLSDRNNLIIDCRDNVHLLRDYYNLKLNIDCNFGSIFIHGKQQLTDAYDYRYIHSSTDSSEYVLGKDLFYMNLFACYLIVDVLIPKHMSLDENFLLLFDLEGGSKFVK
jgi:molybdopterin/thiamine biosynthesis adenylyltransferase